MIPCEITHRSTQVGVNSGDIILTVSPQLSHMAASCYDAHTNYGSQALVLGSPVVLLLDDGGQLLVEDLQVGEAHLQGVSLWPNELLGLPDVLHLTVPGLKPACSLYHYYHHYHHHHNHHHLKTHQKQNKRVKPRFLRFGQLLRAPDDNKALRPDAVRLTPPRKPGTTSGIFPPIRPSRSLRHSRRSLWQRPC